MTERNLCNLCCVCVQLASAAQNTLGHDQSSSVPESVLRKDELDSILGDVSGSHLTTGMK